MLSVALTLTLNPFPLPSMPLNALIGENSTTDGLRCLLLITRRIDPPWQNFLLEADAALEDAFGGIQAGRVDAFSSLYLGLDQSKQRIVLEWIFTPPSGSDLSPRDVRIENRNRWVEALNKTIGPHLGRQGGGLFHPISMDASADGRMYVLDAGNARIAVFDRDGRFITQWGNPGSDEGEFDFGDENLRVRRGINFIGSVAVDDESNIYVADGFNRRIQKFAP